MPAQAAGGPSVEQIFSALPPWGSLPSRVLWAPDGRSFLYVADSQDREEALAVRQYDVQTLQSRILIDPARYGGRPQTPRNPAWSPDGSKLAFSVHGTLYVRDMATNLDRALAAGVSDAQWSPRGDAIAYVHDADLYVASLEPKLRVVRLTTNGVPDAILNGDLDWVYPEEFGTQHGFAWEPDGSAIAYVRMDERRVTNFPLVDFLPDDNAVTYERYPLAGERNPRVALHVVDLRTRNDAVVYDAAANDEYVPFFGWKPGSKTLLAEVLDRGQKHLRVLAFGGGKPFTLYEQTDAKWVDAEPLPVWLRGGASLWVLERENAPGLYLRDASGGLKRLTGAYRTTSLLAVDEKKGTAYVAAAYPTRRDASVLAVPLAGGEPVNLTPLAGSHVAVMSPGCNLFVDTHSTLNDPPQTDLVEADSRQTRATLAARNDALASEMLPVQMLSVPSEYGALDAYMIKPPRFDPAKRYPVIVYVYGGPEMPTTANVFGYSRGLYHQLLARRGFIVFSIDGPASQIDNEAHVRLLYHDFGEASLLGQKLGVAYLRSLPYVDASRIGIWGWSFGGYETVYALTHSDLFKAGAAGAPVTDWHLYDSIYTERYMGLPKNDPQGYDRSSTLDAADALHGDLLISHGTSDDNVHMANSVALLQSLMTAEDARVSFMAYPRQHHGFTALADLRRLYERMLDWWTTHL